MSLATPLVSRGIDRPALAGGLPIRHPDRYLVFGRPHLTEEDVAEVLDALKSGWIGRGPRVTRFEADFAAYTGSPHGVAMSSCTTALRLAMLASGVGPGDEVITTPLTFCATVNAILHSGAVPVLADCRVDDMNIDPAEVERKITPRTRAILPVHFAGRLCNMEALTAIAERHDLRIIEDCAHAIETKDASGRHAGTFGRMGAFSFYATKNITTGEGGMVITRDRATAERLRILALHGMSQDAWRRYSDSGYRHYDIVELGYKCNMTDLQAALAVNQLARVEENLALREAIWDEYDRAFADLPLTTPAPVTDGSRHARHLYTILIDGACRISRDRMLSALHAEGIGAGVHYLPINGYTFYRETLGVGPGDFPNAESVGSRTLSLPISPGMTPADVADVVDAVRRILLWPDW